MAKEAYYFSHDSNARHDPKITAMRSVYGSEGYGWFWIIVEMMREANEYKLEMQGKYTFNAYAMQMHTDCNTSERFIKDCINEFELFKSDGTHFWSPSLLRRMDLREQTSEKRRDAANKRWEKQRSNANASESDANAMQGKERKRNKNESNEEKDTTTDDFKIIHDEFLKIHGMNFMKPKDMPVITELLKEGIDKETIIEVMSERYQFKKASGESVNGFSYYVEPIRARHRFGKKEPVHTKRRNVSNILSIDERMQIERDRPNEQPLPGWLD